MQTGDGPHQNDEGNVDPITGQPIGSDQFSYGGQVDPPASSAAGLLTVESPPAHHQPRSASLAVALTLLLAVGAGVTVLAVNSEGDRVAGKPVAGDEVVPSDTESSTTTAPMPSDTSLEEVLVDPVVPGWQGLRSPKDGVVYDVPKDWTIEDPDVITGYTDPNGKPTIVMHGVARYKEGGCGQTSPGEMPHSRGSVGFVSVDTEEPAEIAPEIAERWAEAAGANDTGNVPNADVSPIEETTVANGAIPATVARATVVPVPTDECTAPTLLVTTVAFALDDGSTALFLMELDQQVADALDDATVATMIQSLRPDS